MQQSGRPALRSPGRGVIGRAVMIAALWSMVATLVGAVVVLMAGLLGGAIAGIAWLASNGQADLADTDLIWRVAEVSAWIVGALVLAVAVWVAAYASTEWGSRPRALVALGAGGLATVAYLLLGSAGLVVAGLGLGWAIAIPAERIGRVAARAVTSLAVALLVPRFESVPTGTVALLLAVSPWVAAVLVWLSDWVWVLVTKRIGKPPDE